MKRFTGILYIIFFLAAMAVTGYGKSTQEYNSEIEQRTVNLRELKKNLKAKRVEKEKFLLEEKNIRREMSKITQQLASLQKESEKIRRDIRKAEKKLAEASRELKAAGWEKQQWLAEIDRELDFWNRAHGSYFKLFGNPVAEKLRWDALGQKKGFLTQAQLKEISSQKSMEKWKKAQQRLSDLKVRQAAMIAEQEAVKGQKKDLLKTTVGRRVVAEDEIKRLVESAQALEQLITRLGREKKKSEEEMRAERKAGTKRYALPWPVAGETVVHYGRNKHAELDTYVISNGIKIRSRSDAAVHAVEQGQVIYCGEFRSYGLMIIIDHGNGLYTLYGQLGEIDVEDDQKVAGGSIIGKAGHGSQPLVYFELRNGGKPEDPLLWLKNQ
jgi:septal ring factor EnvC (AmiA/AmiB activator)